jgi:hypothetical protein
VKYFNGWLTYFRSTIDNKYYVAHLGHNCIGVGHKTEQEAKDHIDQIIAGGIPCDDVIYKYVSSHDVYKAVDSIFGDFENGFRVGDTVKTEIGEYIVGEIAYDNGGKYVVPEGANDYTYWIPVENIISYSRKRI